MGQYYKIVNVKKKQYISPLTFGDGSKLMEFSMSANGVLAGLAILLADGNGQGGGDLNSINPIVGSWAGDNIVIAGDYATAGKFVKDQNDNLYSVATNEGEDISLKVLDALFDDNYFFDEFRKNSITNDEVNTLVKKKLKEKGLSTREVFEVPSSKDPNVIYEIIEEDNVWTCTCPAGQYRKGDCKHITEIKLK